jgi:hypothetical protein
MAREKAKKLNGKERQYSLDLGSLKPLEVRKISETEVTVEVPVVPAQVVPERDRNSNEIDISEAWWQK